MARINGIAHISSSVSDIEMLKSFYRKLFEQLGMKTVLDQDDSLYGSAVKPEWSLGSTQKEIKKRNSMN